MPVPERSSDPYAECKLSEIIAEVYSDGLIDGQAWSSNSRTHGARDYAMERADVLEAEVERLREALRWYAVDKQQGAMPSYVQQREDHVELWAAFRKHVGIGWTSARIRDFIAGWDASRREHVVEVKRLYGAWLRSLNAS